MANKTEYSRLVLKRAASSGVTPTIATYSPTTIDNTWLATDILPGEFFLNLADDRVFTRTDNGIIEFVTTSTYSSTDIWENKGSDIQLSASYSTLPVLPATDDTSDLGSSTYRWKDLYLGSVLDVASHLTYSVSGTAIYKYDNTGIQLQSEKVIKSSNGGGQLDLDYGGSTSEVLLSTDNGSFTESALYMEPYSANLFVADGGVGTNNLHMNAGSQYISISAGATDDIKIAIANNSIFYSRNGGNFITTNSDLSPVVISSRNSTMGSGIINSFIGGGYTNVIKLDSDKSSIIGGSNNTIADTNNAVIVGGDINLIDDFSENSVIAGGSASSIGDVSLNGFIGGGQSHNIEGGNNSAIIGGVGGTVSTGVDRAVILGGSGLVATASDTVYIEDLDISGNIVSTVTITDSVTLESINHNWENLTQTTNAATTTVLTIPVGSNIAMMIEANVVGMLTNNTKAISTKIRGTYRNNAGTISLVGTTTSDIKTDLSTAAITLVISGTDVLVRVTGEADTAIDWGSSVITHKVQTGLF